MKPKPPLEREVLDACLNWLNAQEGIWAWRRNVGMTAWVDKGKKRFARFGQKGMADIEGVVGVDVDPGMPWRVMGTLTACILEVESKRIGNKPTDEQAVWLAAIEAAGGIGLWANSVEMLEKKLREALLARGYEL